MSGERVLMVDDDEAILEAVTMILEEYNFRVRTSTKPNQIIELIDQFKPEVILLDVLMAGVDGRDICKQLKSNASTKNIPLIMVSAHPNASKSVVECGANDFIAKPFDLDDFIEKIKSYLISSELV